MTDSYFEEKQQRINEFVKRANQVLGNNPLCYPGHYITGQVEAPDILFVSINPGHSNRENWEDIELRLAETEERAFQKVPCKYISDVERGSRYANRIVEIVCNGDIERLNHCAETSYISYFAAPKEEILQAQLADLSIEMQTEHVQLTSLDIDKIKPKHILCMGWRSFDRFLQLYGEGNEITVKKLPLMGEMEPYYAYTEVSGVRVHGLRHLCTKLTLEMRTNLQQIFQQVWADLDQTDTKNADY